MFKKIQHFVYEIIMRLLVELNANNMQKNSTNKMESQSN